MVYSRSIIAPAVVWSIKCA